MNFRAFRIQSNQDMACRSSHTYFQISVEIAEWVFWYYFVFVFELVITSPSGKWSSITCTGTRPPPCCVFSLTMIDNHRAVLFGGELGSRRHNDAYTLELSTMVRRT